MILDAMFRPTTTRSIENPAIPLTADNLVRYLMAGQAAASGVTVNRHTIMNLAGVWRGVNLLSDAVASVHCHVLRLMDGGKKKERDLRHPSYARLRYQSDPRDWVSAHTFFKTMQAQAVLEGVAFAAIVRNGAGEAERLVVANAEDSGPVRRNGQLFYLLRIDDVENKFADIVVSAEDCICIKGLGYSGLTAYRLVDHLKDAFGQALAVQRYGGKFFANDASGRVVVELPYKFPNAEAAQEFKKRFMEKYSGVENAGRPLVLDNGGKIHSLNINNEDAQFIETSRLTLVTLANILNLPASLLGDDAKTSYASLEQEYKSLLLHSINPWLERWEQELWAKMLREDEKASGSHTIKFERKGFLITDLGARTQFYQMGLQNKTLTPNMVLEQEDMNPVPWGDEPLPLPNESVSGDSDEPPAAPPLEPPSRDVDQLDVVMREQLIDVLGAVYRRLSHAVERAAKKPDRFLDWLDEHLVKDHYKIALDMVARPLRACLLVRGSAADMTAQVVDGIFDSLRDELLRVAGENQADELKAATDELMLRFEATASESIVSQVVAAVGPPTTSSGQPEEQRQEPGITIINKIPPPTVTQAPAPQVTVDVAPAPVILPATPVELNLSNPPAEVSVNVEPRVEVPEPLVVIDGKRPKKARIKHSDGTTSNITLST